MVSPAVAVEAVVAVEVVAADQEALAVEAVEVVAAGQGVLAVEAVVPGKTAPAAVVERSVGKSLAAPGPMAGIRVVLVPGEKRPLEAENDGHRESRAEEFFWKNSPSS